MFRAALVVSLLLSLFATACAGRDAPVEAPAAGDDGGSMAVCAPEAPDCVDTVVSDDGSQDEFDAEQARSDARALLGTPETELDGSVRVGRRGDEQMMLTEDYVLGRMTVELDEREGEFRVTAVTVELPDGPETYR